MLMPLLQRTITQVEEQHNTTKDKTRMNSLCISATSVPWSSHALDHSTLLEGVERWRMKKFNLQQKKN
jgi:hypothetical protein